jgi:hypothetical protein
MRSLAERVAAPARAGITALGGIRALYAPRRVSTSLRQSSPLLVLYRIERLLMRFFLVLATVLALASFRPALGQEKAVPLPQEGFLGEWVNINEVVYTAKRLVVSKDDNAWFVEAFVPTIMVINGAAKEADVSLGKTKLNLAGASPDAKALPFGFTARDLKVSVQYSTLRVEKAELVVETFTIFSEKAGKSNYRTVERFKKK